MDFSRHTGVLRVTLSQADLARPDDMGKVYGTFENLILERGERRIIVDLSGVTMLTSLMIGTLVSLHLMAYENVVVLTFENVHEKIRTLFKLIGVDRLIEAHYPKQQQEGNRE